MLEKVLWELIYSDSLEAGVWGWGMDRRKLGKTGVVSTLIQVV